MPDNTTPFASGKATYGFGETVGSGLYGEQLSVTYNAQTGEAQLKWANYRRRHFEKQAEGWNCLVGKREIWPQSSPRPAAVELPSGLCVARRSTL